MISVGEEADSFGRIGECEKAQRTRWALSDLDQSYEHAEDADSEDHEAQQTPLAIAKQKCANKDRKRSHKGKRAQPCCAWRDAHRHPRKFLADNGKRFGG